MRDPGSVVSVVASYLVKPKQKLNKVLCLELINGFKCKHKVAKVQVESPYYNGILEACIIDAPPFDLIIGNVNGDDLCPKETITKYSNDSCQTATAVTRSQAREKGRQKKMLSISDVGEILTDPKMEQLQKEDPSLKSLFDLVNSGEGRTRGNKTSNFILSHGLLYRRVVTHKDDRQVNSTDQLVVPSVYRNVVFRLKHSEPLAGHQGKAKTLRRIQKYFFWPAMWKQIDRWTSACDVCQRTTDKGHVKPAPLQQTVQCKTRKHQEAMPSLTATVHGVYKNRFFSNSNVHNPCPLLIQPSFSASCEERRNLLQLVSRIHRPQVNGEVQRSSSRQKTREEVYVLEAEARRSEIRTSLCLSDSRGSTPLGFWSRELNPTEKEYYDSDKKLLAIHEGIEIFFPYIHGNKFIVEP